MSLRILWCDNDLGLVSLFATTLTDAGHSVKLVRAVGEAERHLEENQWDLLILDVMIPPTSNQEVQSYPSEKTNGGGHTGLEFFRRHGASLRARGIKVFVFTVRAEKHLRDQFVEDGLPARCYATKMELSDQPSFLERIAEIANLKN